MRAWTGRHASACTANTLASKGRTCHLCGRPGADSADHDPPRSVLIARGEPDPDDQRFLFPAHLVPCNTMRGRQPITERLREACRRARVIHESKAIAAASLSPRLAARRLEVLRATKASGKVSCREISPSSPTKNPGNEQA